MSDVGSLPDTAPLTASPQAASAQATSPQVGAKSPAASLVGVVVRRRRRGERGEGESPPVSLSAPAATVAPTAVPTPAAPVLAAPPPVAVLETPPAPVAPAAVPPSPVAASAEDLIRRWAGWRNGGTLPAVSVLDAAGVGEHWPQSLLFRAIEARGGLDVEPERRFGAAAGDPVAIDSMALEWVVEVAREVALRGEPVHETDNLPTPLGWREFGVIALPFGDGGQVGHILCHLYRL